MPGLMKEMLRSSTVMFTSMVVLLEMTSTVSPLFTSAPSVRVQVMTVPSMGATALKLARPFSASASFCWASVMAFCLSRICWSMVSEPMVSSTSPAETLA